MLLIHILSPPVLALTRLHVGAELLNVDAACCGKDDVVPVVSDLHLLKIQHLGGGQEQRQAGLVISAMRSVMHVKFPDLKNHILRSSSHQKRQAYHDSRVLSVHDSEPRSSHQAAGVGVCV